jgi:hypothetical protein
MIGFENAKNSVYLNDMFLSMDGETPATSISSLLPNQKTSEDFFDIWGRKVKNPSKGIYIKEGKKFLFK